MRATRPAWIMPLVSGLLLGMAFPLQPALHLEVLAWFALVPLLLAVEHVDRFIPFFRRVLLSTGLFCALTLWWVSIATVTGGILTMAVQALFCTVPLIMFYFLKRRAGFMYALFTLPFLWTGWEWAYMQQDFSLGWLTLGNSQAGLISMVQYADILGVWGVSFWVVCFNVLTVAFLKARHAVAARSGIALVAVLMVAVPLGYASHVFSAKELVHDDIRSVRVSIVQPNIDPHDKWVNLTPEETLGLLYRLTGEAVRQGHPDLVLWPETAIPFTILDQGNQGYRRSLFRSVERWNTAVLTGFTDRVYRPAPGQVGFSGAGAADGDGTTLPEGSADTYNASMLLQPGVPVPQIYHKKRLVPFGERVPYVEYFPWLERMSFSLSGISSWQKGTDATVMTFRDSKGEAVRTANIICYESIFPGLVAEFVRKGAQFLTLVTNDGWYAKSSGPWQHAVIGRLRCIENRRAMARCANTGFTVFYDRYGRMYADMPWWQSGVLNGEIALYNQQSLYTRYPDLFPKAALAIAVLLTAAGMTKKNKAGFFSESDKKNPAGHS